MIDTVKIRIPKEKMRTLVGDNFPKWELVGQDARKYKRLAKNPTLNQKKENYFPKLWSYARWLDGKYQSVYIIIEFSVPKLLFQNSLYEVVENDFRAVILALKDRLQEMGEIMSMETLENAEVMSVHASKNIILKEYITLSILKELRKINISKKFHLSEEKFKNGGHILHIYTDIHSVSFYDKLFELDQGPTKAFDKDQTPSQKTLYLKIKKLNPMLEVLRMEVRLIRRPKMNSVLKNLGFKENPTLKDVFKKDICQKIVLFYWEEVIKGENIFLFELSNNPMKLYARILQTNPKIKVKEAMNLVALSVLAKDDGGIREFRTLTEKRTKQRNWYRISDGIKKLNKLAEKQPLHSWVKQIDDAIKEFKPLKELDVIP